MPIGYDATISWAAPTTVYDKVTARIHGPSQLTVRYGRDQARALSPMAPGTAEFTLINQDQVLLPEKTSSPLYGYVTPGKNVTIQATLPEAGILSDPALVLPFTLPGVISRGPAGLYFGYVDDLTVLPDISERKVTISCTDALGRLHGVTVSTELYQGLTSGQALHKLLDVLGVPADKRDIDAGATTFPWWWISGGDAYDEAVKIVDSEGPTALLTVGVDGTYIFRDRHHRLVRAESTAAQATWSGNLTEPVLSPPIGYDHGWKDVVNDVTFDVAVRGGTGSPEQVWNSGDTLAIAAGQTLTVTASGLDPFLNAVVPVEGVDYTVVSGAVSVALSVTSGTATTISLTALAGSPASVTGLQLRASVLRVLFTARVHAEDGASIAKYGRRTWPDTRAPEWASLQDVAGIASMILGHRGERLPTLTVTFSGSVTRRLVEQLTRDLSDRVHITDGVSFTDADFFVEQISHSTDGVAHQTTFGCEKVPSQVANVFILGSATSGILGSNRLGRRGIDDPAKVFVLGSGSNGVLGSNLLAA